MSAPVRDLVALVIRDGSLYGARPGRATKTLTVNDQRRYRIRVQADICREMMAPGDPAEYFYPDLVPEIRSAVAELRP